MAYLDREPELKPRLSQLIRYFRKRILVMREDMPCRAVTDGDWAGR